MKSADHVPSNSNDMVERHERQFRIALNAMPVPLSWARLSDGNIQFMNRKFTETYGYRVGDFATVEEWVDKAYPVEAHRDRAEKAWYAFFGNPTEAEFEIDPVEVDILCKDGTVRTALHGGVILPEAGWALATFVDITKRKRDEVLIRQLAEEDALTGLANRRVFQARLEQQVDDTYRNGGAIHILMVDLDHFKDVNDQLGHETGDNLLREVAALLRESVRRTDTVARLGGDEFGIILPNSGDGTEVDRICRKIIDAVARPKTLEGQQVRVGVSVGVARFPDDADSVRGLLRAADQALYHVKAHGRGSWQYASRIGQADGVIQ